MTTKKDLSRASNTVEVLPVSKKLKIGGKLVVNLQTVNLKSRIYVDFQSKDFIVGKSRTSRMD